MLYEAYKKVALAGASGNLGSVVLKELIKSNLFEITVLSRASSTFKYPPEVKEIKADFESLESLTTALKGQQALVSTVASLGVKSQKLLIDAAVQAGVKRIIPSEFGCDLHNAKARTLPVYAAKVEIEKYLDELAVKGQISYTLLFTGPLLDFGLKHGIFFNFKERKAELFDGGDYPFSTTTLATAGKAVRRVLTHPPETADRAIRVKDIDISQKQLVKLAQALTPGEEWDLKDVDTAELEKQSLEDLKTKQMKPTTMLNFLRRAIFNPGYGNKWEHVHNSVLGIREMTEPDLEELIHNIFGPK
ncbi:hypothetical protein LSUE1_G001559 [Lachnellula suecica]|uniref:NmrA-like domain-containing protein n=1 Tax=Lachnellula suecica TaxID=602035 RepID=A0A8T9CHQ7_9HELO|nr:hypothetical protein LSUE1_G001559 [Lachnellula suecica]